MPEVPSAPVQSSVSAVSWWRVLPAWFWLLLASGAFAGAIKATNSPGSALVGVTPLAAPESKGAADEPALARGPDGSVWMIWLETDANDTTRLQVAALDPAGRRWQPPHTITTQQDWTKNVFDLPQLVVRPDGRLTAVWSVAPANAPDGRDDPEAYLSDSTDHGVTWSKPRRLTTAGRNVEYVSLAVLANGDLLAVWIDGRNRSDESGPAQLFSRIVDRDEADTLVDASVCDCCRSSLVALPSGGALLAYRGRKPGEIRDIQGARYEAGHWLAGPGVATDGWKIAGCPVNGPGLSQQELCVSQAWFTGAGEQPRVLAARSLDRGVHFEAPVKVDAGHPLGKADTLALPGNRQVVAWVENLSSGPAVLLRPVSAAGEGGSPYPLARLPADNAARVSPRLALVSTAPNPQIVLAFAASGTPGRVESYLVELAGPSAEGNSARR